MSWLTGWNRRKQITINGSTAGIQSDYQIKLTVNQTSGTDSVGIVYLGGNVLTTFNDLRFTKSDGTTTLYYWIESIIGTTPNQTAIVWIKLAPYPDTIPASPGTYNLYIYYNNSSATTSVSNGANTFVDFDHFDDVNLGGWTQQDPQDGAWTVSNSILTKPSGNDPPKYMKRNTPLPSGVTNNFALRSKFQAIHYGQNTSLKYEYILNSLSPLTNTTGNTISYQIASYYTNQIFHNYYGSANGDSGIPMSGSTWYIGETKINTSGNDSTSIYDASNYSLIGSHTTSVHTSSGNYWGYISYYEYSQVDWVLIRKYISPEPTITCIGGEEVSTVSWLSGWNRRKLTTVIGSISGAQTDYQMNVTVHKETGTDTSTDIYLGANVKDDFSDLRFTPNDGSTLLSYWIESITGSAPFIATVWIKIPSIPANPCTTTIYTYYDNPSAASVSNGTNTFNFFSTSLWGTAGPTFGTNYAMRGRIQFTITGPSWGFGWYNDPRIMIISNTSYDPDIRYYSTITGYATIGESLNINHPYKTFDIIRNGTTNVIVRVDNGSETTYTNMGSGTISIAAYSSFNHLWTLVHKYISPEPTFWTIGTEELNITAYSMSLHPSETPCRTGICTIRADVTWQNLGSSSITFRPTILVDGTPIQAASDITIGANPAIGSSSITTPTLAVGTHSICPYPN